MLLNAFPIQIVADGSAMTVRAATLDEARAALAVGSAIGHADTAGLLTTILGAPVPMARVTIPTTTAGDVVVAQYSGPRLPEGATVLPDGASLVFRRIMWDSSPGRLQWRRGNEMRARKAAREAGA